MNRCQCDTWRRAGDTGRTLRLQGGGRTECAVRLPLHPAPPHGVCELQQLAKGEDGNERSAVRQGDAAEALMPNTEAHNGVGCAVRVPCIDQLGLAAWAQEHVALRVQRALKGGA